MGIHRTHFVCLPCRASYKKTPDRVAARRDVCPRCGGTLINAGAAFAAPRRRDDGAWRALTAVLNAGLRFRQDCCGGPGYRPRTPREVRTRLTYAAAAAIPVPQALACAEPGG